MNHLEQLVSEWLQYKGYFVRTSVPVGARDRGGYEGELNVVAVHLPHKHLLHVECSLDALSKEKRQERFRLKFERGARYIHEAFKGLELPEKVDQIVILQFASGIDREFGGARLVTGRELIHEIIAGLQGTSPASKAVSSNLPLLRTLQLAADANAHLEADNPLHRIVRTIENEGVGDIEI